MTENSNNDDLMYNVSLNSDEGEQSVVVGNAELQYESLSTLPTTGKQK